MGLLRYMRDFATVWSISYRMGFHEEEKHEDKAAQRQLVSVVDSSVEQSQEKEEIIIGMRAKRCLLPSGKDIMLL